MFHYEKMVPKLKIQFSLVLISKHGLRYQFPSLFRVFYLAQTGEQVLGSHVSSYQFQSLLSRIRGGQCLMKNILVNPQ